MMARGLRNADCSGAVLTFGRNGVDADYRDLLRIFEKENKHFRTLPSEEIVRDPLTQFGDTIHQDVFFKMLGYSEVHSVDYYPKEQPTFILDLNKPVPDHMRGRYDLVSDSGTMEHCFDVKEVLFNTVRLLKPGGHVCIHTPMSGHVDHGFYSFSPSLFFDFYGANGFDEMKLSILRDCGTCLGGIKRYDYDPDTAEVIGDLFPKSLIFFMARKRGQVEPGIPIQNYYRMEFGGERGAKAVSAWKEVLKAVMGKRFAYVLYRLSLRFRRFFLLHFGYERLM